MNTRKLAPVLALTAASKRALEARFCVKMPSRKFMSRTTRKICSYRVVLLIFVCVAVGCQTMVVPPRPDPDRTEIERTPAERPPDVRPSAKTEIVGTVERVDKAKNEIQLRTTEAKVIVIKYDPATLVYSRERQVGMEALRLRDLILVRVAKNPLGEEYADLIRLNDRKEQ